MRITFVLAGADLTGGNRVISIYADRLQRRGHEVTVISRPHRPITLKDKARALLRGQPIPVNRKRWPSHFDSVPGIQHYRIESYRPILADDLPDADVVIATWWETAEWVATFPPSKGAKAYFIQHYEAHPGQDASRVDATWRLPMRKIVIAQWLADLARDKFGDTDISLIPNAVDLQQFNAPPRDKQSSPSVGLMYSIVGYKACDISLAAIELARKAVPDLKVVSFGNRKPAKRLPLPIGADYTVQPPQDRLREIYARCDIWLVTSRSEGFGLPILEAMACRTPVIATATGAAPQLITGGGGVIVPFDDPAATAREIERIVKLPAAQWQAISDAAYITATRYTWDDATTLFESALSKVSIWS